MKITIISSSQRKDSESKRVADYIKKELDKKLGNSETLLINLSDLTLPFYDDSFDENISQQDLWNPTAKTLLESDGFIFITPEWNGMASPMLKNFFMYTETELAHKPALIVSVSSNIGGGAYPVAELRSSSYKNNFVCYIPNHVIIRNVGQCLIEEVLNPENKSDSVARTRIDYSLDVLLAYTKSMKTMRDNVKIDWMKFPFGM